MTVRGMGYLPDPPKAEGESPDWKADMLLSAAPVPETHSNSSLILSVLDQGGYPSCVGNAVAQGIRAEMVRRGVQDPVLGSRMWLWALSRLTHGALSEWGGTYIRNCCGVAAGIGLPPETSWPYDDADVRGRPRWQRRPGTEVFRLAHDQRSPLGYYRIDSDGDQRILDIKRASSAGHTIAFGTQVAQSFLDLDSFDVVGPPKVGEPIAGGHAMLIIGYDKLGAIVVNSWGTGFGLGGMCRLSWDYILWAFTNDMWVIADVPEFPQEAA